MSNMFFEGLDNFTDILQNNIQYKNLLSIISSLPNATLLSDPMHNFIAVNQQALTIFGAQDLDCVIGKKCEDMPYGGSELADEFKKYRLQAQQGKTVKNLSCHYCGKDNILQTFIGSFSPIYNHNNKILGICSQGVNVSNLLLNSISSYMQLSSKFFPKKIKQFVIRLDDSYSSLNLPIRQAEVFFFILRGKTDKEIAKILNLSFRTINDYVNTLKDKLHCSTRRELIEIGVEKGYLGILPETLIYLLKNQANF